MPTTRFAFGNSPELPSPDALALYGPTLRVEIGFDPDFPSGGSVRPNLPIDRVPALVDTGAEDNYIDSTLANELRLPVLEDRRVIIGALDSNEVDAYIAQIYIPDLEYTIVGSFAGIHLASGGLRHRAVIGRSFLRHFTLLYEGRTGIVTLSND